MRQLTNRNGPVGRRWVLLSLSLLNINIYGSFSFSCCVACLESVFFFSVFFILSFFVYFNLFWFVFQWTSRGQIQFVLDAVFNVISMVGSFIRLCWIWYNCFFFSFCFAGKRTQISFCCCCLFCFCTEILDMITLMLWGHWCWNRIITMTLTMISNYHVRFVINEFLYVFYIISV